MSIRDVLRPGSAGRPRRSLLAAWDRAFVDAPSLCCDDGALCAACAAEATLPDAYATAA